MIERSAPRHAIAILAVTSAAVATTLLLSANPTAHATAPRSASLPITISGAAHELPAGSWGLALLNSAPASHQPDHYWYPQTAGAGAQVYVVDTGVQADLPEFEGRVTDGFDATTATVDFSATGSATVDCSGHGTSVASLIAASNVGVAPKATIIPLRALPCTGGAQSGSETVIKALNWIRDHHDPATTGIINLSFGYLVDKDYAGNTELRDTIESLLDDGFFITAAAGNDSEDAAVMDSCADMPAQIPGVFTVGAIDQADGDLAGRASFSDAGSCVDVWAPGVSLPALDAQAPGTTSSFQGTSAAAPQVAGLAALLVGEIPGITAAEITERLIAYAAKDTLDPDTLMATTTYAAQSGSIAPQSIAAAGPNLVVRTPFDMPHFTAKVGQPHLARTASTLTITWNTPDLEGQTPVTDYDITVYMQIPKQPDSLTTTTIRIPATTTTYKLTDVNILASYMIEVTPISSGMPGKTSIGALSASICSRWCPRP